MTGKWCKFINYQLHLHLQWWIWLSSNNCCAKFYLQQWCVWTRVLHSNQQCTTFLHCVSDSHQCGRRGTCNHFTTHPWALEEINQIYIHIVLYKASRVLAITIVGIIGNENLWNLLAKHMQLSSSEVALPLLSACSYLQFWRRYEYWANLLRDLNNYPTARTKESMILLKTMHVKLNIADKFCICTDRASAKCKDTNLW